DGGGQPSRDQSKTARPSLDINQWQKKIDELEKQLNDEASARRKSLDEERKAGRLSEEQFNDKIRRLESDAQNRASQIPEVAIAKENSKQRRLWILITVAAIIDFGVLG